MLCTFHGILHKPITYISVHELSLIIYIPSSLLMITVALLELLVVTLSGSDSLLISRINSSLSSNTLSLIIETLNVTLVIPAGIVMLYGPES